MRKTSQFYLKQKRVEKLPLQLQPPGGRSYRQMPPNAQLSFNHYDLTENSLAAFEHHNSFVEEKVKPRFDPSNPEVKNTSNLENINYFFDGERWQTLRKKDNKDSRVGKLGDRLDEQD